jgi:hypothetical protein
LIVFEAGIVAAVFYLAMTTWFALSVELTLSLFSVFPLSIYIVYGIVLSPIRDKTETSVETTENKESTGTLLEHL